MILKPGYYTIIWLCGRRVGSHTNSITMMNRVRVESSNGENLDTVCLREGIDSNNLLFIFEGWFNEVR